MVYTGPERRKGARVSGRFVVSYRILEEYDNVDVSQTKNFSLGGMMLTTNRQFEIGTKIALEIRLPFDPRPINLVGVVRESREVTKDLIYDTRLEFITVEKMHKEIMTKTVDYYQKREP